MGASSLGEGASALQCHMTNSRMTDPEVLEQRTPLTVLRFQTMTRTVFAFSSPMEKCSS